MAALDEQLTALYKDPSSTLNKLTDGHLIVDEAVYGRYWSAKPEKFENVVGRVISVRGERFEDHGPTGGGNPVGIEDTSLIHHLSISSHISCCCCSMYY